MSGGGFVVDWLYAIDPGVHEHGVALFNKRELVSCRLTLAGAPAPVCPPVSRGLVIEVPRSYGSARQRGDQNDLIDLAFEAGAVAAQFPRAFVLRVSPAKWKHQLPKRVVWERTKEKLTKAEIELAESTARAVGKKGHNVLDAVALGVWYLKGDL